MSILELTKLDLQILSDEYDGYIQSLIAASKKAITTEGIVLNEDSVEDGVLISAYARHLYRDRANSNLNSAMPRFLRRMLNDRLFSQKASE